MGGEQGNGEYILGGFFEGNYFSFLDPRGGGGWGEGGGGGGGGGVWGGGGGFWECPGGIRYLTR